MSFLNKIPNIFGLNNKTPEDIKTDDLDGATIREDVSAFVNSDEDLEDDENSVISADKLRNIQEAQEQKNQKLRENMQNSDLTDLKEITGDTDVPDFKS